MFVKPVLRRSLLAKMLSELLSTRVMVKNSMKLIKNDKVKFSVTLWKRFADRSQGANASLQCPSTGLEAFGERTNFFSHTLIGTQSSTGYIWIHQRHLLRPHAL